MIATRQWLPLAAASLSALGAVAMLTVQATGDEPRPTGPLVVRPEAPPDQPLAEVEGRLRISDGCATIGGSPVVWPRGTWWDEGSVVLPTGDRLDVGSDVSGLSGGYYTDGRDLRGVIADQPAEAVLDCTALLGADQVVVVN